MIEKGIQVEKMKKMKKITAVLKGLLLAWGGLSFLGAFVLAGFLVYQWGPGNRAKIDSASASDIRFVLNWCSLGDERIEKVIHSYMSPRSLAGDHLDVYAIKVAHLNAAELTADTDSRSRWHRGDQLPQIVDDAVSFAGTWRGVDEAAWFPREAELISGEVYGYLVSIYYHGTAPWAADIVFARPRDRMIFFFSGKT